MKLNRYMGGDNVKFHWKEKRNKPVDDSQDVLTDNAIEKEEKSDKITGFECFFCKEDGSEKWAKKYIKCWYNIMCFLWLVFGSLTFAPIVFIAKKSGEIIPNKKASSLFGICLYAVIVFLISILILK